MQVHPESTAQDASNTSHSSAKRAKIGDTQSTSQYEELDWASAKTIKLTSLSGDLISIEQLCQEKKTLLIFMRKLICATCSSYIILFGHLKSVLSAANIRIVFITCHSDLKEVQQFLRNFAFWLRDLARKEAKAAGKSGEGNVLQEVWGGVLPAEIYLDGNRDSYRFFGIGQAMNRVVNYSVILRIRFMRLLGYTTANKMKPSMSKDESKDVRRFIRRYFAEAQQAIIYERKLSDPSINQSAAIVVVENKKIIYRYIVKDQQSALPQSGDGLSGALGCDRAYFQDMQKVVDQGFDTFVECVMNKQVKAEMKSNELVVGRMLGDGMESEVYLAEWIGQKVAVKIFKTDAAKDKNGTENAGVSSFANEAALLMSLRHKNVIHLMGFGCEPPNKNFIVAEFMTRGSLFDMVTNSKIELSAERKQSILLDIAEGMNFLHSCQPKVIHQDLKSLNVLIRDDWVCKVSDFGMARELRAKKTALQKLFSLNADSNDENEEKEEQAGGTIQWMAPELLQTDAPATTKSDVFAFAVIMWEVAERKHPWYGVPIKTVAKNVISGERLPHPFFDAFWSLVADSWSQVPAVRPDFKYIVKKLRKLQIPV